MNILQTVAELGEFELIAALTQRLGAPTASGVIVGSGDDSAVTEVKNSSVVSCLDVLVQGVHFRTDWSSASEVGHKAVAANLADIFAMGATPQYLLVGLAIPADTKVQWVLELADGMKAEADLVGASVIGGDIVKSDQIVISVTALGHLSSANPITRGGAKVGDVVALAGQLGYSAAGLMMLSRGFRSPKSIVSLHRAPQPPYELAKLALNAHAMIDVSDGLVSDLGHIAKASAVAIDIDSSKLEVSEELQSMASAFSGDAMNWVLHGGEDHAFVATFGSASQVPQGWTVIGSVSAGSGVSVDGQPVANAGWSHFN